MKPLLLSLSMLSATACVAAPSGSLDAYCIASDAAIADLAQALAETPDEAALRAGDLVIRQRDRVCR
jgi:hypothetical protein